MVDRSQLFQTQYCGFRKENIEAKRITNSARESDLKSGLDFPPEAASEKISSIFSSGNHC
jgi:hypothetical protein